MNDDLLCDPKLKIERAKSHVNDLTREVRAFINSKPHRIIEKPYSYRGQKRTCVFLKLRRNIPDVIPLIAADAVHNLRVSLDQLTYRLAQINGYPNSTNTYFPVARCAQVFKSESRRKLRRLDPVAQEMINRLKPYKGGNNLLWSLHALDIADKHRIVVPVGSANFGTNISQLSRSEHIRVYPRNWDSLNDQSKLWSMPTDTHPQGDFKLRLDIEFREVALQGRPIAAALSDLIDLVERIVRTFDKKFF